MTPRITLLLAGAAIAAGCAGTAVSREPSRAGPAVPAARVAVLAGADAGETAVADATGRATTVVRVGGLPEAQAKAAALAAEGYDVVVGLGADARAAVRQAASAEVGAGTRWRTAVAP